MGDQPTATGAGWGPARQAVSPYPSGSRVRTLSASLDEGVEAPGSKEVTVMGYYGGDMGWGGWLAMSLSLVVTWGLLIALVVWVVRSLRGDTSPGNQGLPPTPGSRADQVLAERFARGEIDAEEFTQRRELLHSTSGGVGSGGGASR